MGSTRAMVGRPFVWMQRCLAWFLCFPSLVSSCFVALFSTLYVFPFSFSSKSISCLMWNVQSRSRYSPTLPSSPTRIHHRIQDSMHDIPSQHFTFHKLPQSPPLYPSQHHSCGFEDATLSCSTISDNLQCLIQAISLDIDRSWTKKPSSITLSVEDRPPSPIPEIHINDSMVSIASHSTLYITPPSTINKDVLSISKNQMDGIMPGLLHVDDDILLSIPNPAFRNRYRQRSHTFPEHPLNTIPSSYSSCDKKDSDESFRPRTRSNTNQRFLSSHHPTEIQSWKSFHTHDPSPFLANAKSNIPELPPGIPLPSQQMLHFPYSKEWRERGYSTSTSTMSICELQGKMHDWKRCLRWRRIFWMVAMFPCGWWGMKDEDMEVTLIKCRQCGTHRL